MSIGKDGFTDCTFVCNPDNDMSWSCNQYCPDYVFSSTTPRTTFSLTTQRTFTKPKPGTVDINESEYLLSLVVVLSCTALLILTILLFACCLYKRRLKTYFNTCRGKETQDAQRVQIPANDEEAGPVMPAAGEDKRALLSFESESRSRTDDVTNSNHGNSFSTKRPVNLPNSVYSNRSSAPGKESPRVQALTYAVKPDENQEQVFMEDTGHYSTDETELKEVGERADLAICSSSSFSSNIIPLESTRYSDTETASIDHSYENVRNTDFNEAEYTYRKTDATRNNGSDLSIDTGGQISYDIDLNSNEAASNDYNGGDHAVDTADDNDDDDDEKDEEEDDDDESDDDDGEEQNRAIIAEGDHLLKNGGNSSSLTNKTKNKLASKNGGIVRVTTEINFREV